MASFSIRNAVPKDIPTLLDMLRSVRRMVAFEHELKAWMNFDKEAIFVAVTDQDEVVGSCSGLALSEDRGFVGLYVVKENYRGKGIGSQLFSNALRRLGDRNIGICGRESTFDIYRNNLGFSFVPDYSILYYECHDPKMLKNTTKHDSQPNWDVVDCDFNSNKSLVSRVAQYDLDLHRYSSRTTIVYNILSEPGCICKVALRGHTVAGYICLRPVITGHLLMAPFYADNPDVARTLLNSAVASADLSNYPEGMVVRFPSTNPNCEDLFKAFGFRNSDLVVSTAFNKALIDVPVSKIYSFHSVVFCPE